MTKQEFLKKRRTAWKRFEQLVERRGLRGRSRLNASEVAEFSRLLREVSNDLATIRSRDWGQSLVAYLNPLVANGHNSFYRATPAAWGALLEFLTTGFPRLFRRNGGYFLLAAGLFFVPLAIAWSAVQSEPTRGLRIVPAEQLDSFDQMYRSDTSDENADEKPAGSDPDPAAEKPDESRAGTDKQTTDQADGKSTDDDAGKTGDSSKDEDSVGESENSSPFEEGFGEERAAMAGFYIQHNVGIALQCFARGVLLGVGTMVTLLYNGIVIGCVAGYVLSLGHSEKFLSFVVSHGSFELTAIAIAGGAGLILGDAFVHSGQRTRLESLRVRGMEAVQIAGGAAVMLVIAALIEAFWSPAPIPPATKFLVGGLLWLAVALYLALAGARR